MSVERHVHTILKRLKIKDSDLGSEKTDKNTYLPIDFFFT